MFSFDKWVYYRLLSVNVFFFDSLIFLNDTHNLKKLWHPWSNSHVGQLPDDSYHAVCGILYENPDGGDVKICSYRIEN